MRLLPVYFSYNLSSCCGMLRGCPFGMASEGITRFLRMRLGHKETNGGTISDEDKVNGLDGMGMAGNDNAIMDHCSISWTIDRNYESFGRKNHTNYRQFLEIFGT